MRGVLCILIAGAALWMGLHSCGPTGRSTLVLKPSSSFPADKQQALGRSIARILPHCPGIQKMGDKLEFAALTEDGGLTTLDFTLAEEIPARRGEGFCSLRVTEQEFELEGRAACRALCLGESEDGILRRRLGKAD